MSLRYNVEYTDTFGGDANYCWVRRAVVSTPELTAYGYDGSNGYSRAHKWQRRVLLRKAKLAVGVYNMRGTTTDYGDMIEFRPAGTATVMFITWADD